MPTLVDLAAAPFAALFGAMVAFSIPFRHGPTVPAVGPAPDHPRVVCTQRAHKPDVSDDCDEMETRLTWCNARLHAATRVRPTTAPPEGVDVDDPAEWADEVDHLLAACHIPAAVTHTDCSEYPCVTALRAESDAAMGEPLERCPKDEFTDEDLPALLPISVACPDGRTETLWMLAVADNPTLDELYNSHGSGVDLAQLSLLAARRSEALAKQWTCSP